MNDAAAKLFESYVLPEKIVSDIGTQFTSVDLVSYDRKT